VGRTHERTAYADRYFRCGTDASSDGAYGEVELHPSRKFADSRLSALAAAARAEMIAGFPSGRLFLDSVEQAMAVALVQGHAVRHRSVRYTRRTRLSALAKD
jgi:AraC family transcriptional regulator